jgi:hypothetical protein
MDEAERAEAPRAMTAAPDPNQAADPGSPRRKGLGAAFWACMVFALVMALAGAAVGLFGARLFPVHSAATAAAHHPPRLGNPPPPR